jgi:ribose transport system permease protein
MRRFRLPPAAVRLLADYGMLGVLVLLCLYCSLATLQQRSPRGKAAAADMAAAIAASSQPLAAVLIVAGEGRVEAELADRLEKTLSEAGFQIVEKINGEPPAAAAALNRLAKTGTRVDVIAASRALRRVVQIRTAALPALARTQLVFPRSYWWSTFLAPRNLLNVANQIVVFAVIAVGMTMVIITGGIDLSVGSLVALSAVVATTLIVMAGGEQAGRFALLYCSLAAVAVCAAVGAFSGVMIATFKIPPFIATLGMMQVASGLAFIIAGGQSIYRIPESFTWLGRDADLLSLPNAVILMVMAYLLAHLVMSRTRLGRHIYAVGGNRQAARLSGIRIGRVLLAVYVVSGAMAGLGGVIVASQLKSGAPTYGLMYELYVIAAVVVGGTSLAGGEGKIFGTLIGAFIIAVIRNGMNLTDVQPYTQKVALGLVILGAVLLDMVRKQGWRGWAAAE